MVYLLQHILVYHTLEVFDRKKVSHISETLSGYDDTRNYQIIKITTKVPYPYGIKQKDKWVTPCKYSKSQVSSISFDHICNCLSKTHVH